MDIVIILGFVISFFQGDSVLQDNYTSVTINGEVATSESLEGSYAYALVGASSTTAKFHRGQIRNNRFQIEFHQNHRDTLVYAFLFVSPVATMTSKEYAKNVSNYKLHQFLVDTSYIAINLNYQDDWAEVEGGELNRHKKEFDQVDSVYHAMYRQNSVEEQYKHSGVFLDDLNRYRILNWLALIKKYNSSRYSLSIAGYLANMPLPRRTYQYRKEIADALESLSPNIKATGKYREILISFRDNLKRNEPKNGLLFPNLDLTGKDLKPINLNGIYEGKEFVLLDFWATWCGPCIKQHPTVSKLNEKFKGSNILFVGISIDKERKA